MSQGNRGVFGVLEFWIGGAKLHSHRENVTELLSQVKGNGCKPQESLLGRKGSCRKIRTSSSS